MKRLRTGILAHRARIGVLTPVLLLLALAAPAAAAPLAEIDSGDSTRFVLAGERVLMWAGEDGRDWGSLRAGPFDGPYGIVAGREGGRSVAGPIGVALAPAGMLVAHNDNANRRTLELRPADGSAPVRLGEGTGALAVNGRYAAARTTASAAAYDLETRTRIGDVAADADPGAGPPPVGISASGTLVYTDAADRLWSYAPATRSRTRLLDHVPQVVSVAGERAYVVQRTVTSPFHHLERLVGLDLAGGAPQPLTAALESTQFFTDGARLLYQQPGLCTLYGDLPAAAPERAPVTEGCPRQTLSFAVTERHRRPRARMWVTCPGGPADRCTGTAKLTAKRRTLGRWRFSVAGGTSRTHVMHVKLRRGNRRQVARLRITGSPTHPITRRIVFLR